MIKLPERTEVKDEVRLALEEERSSPIEYKIKAIMEIFDKRLDLKINEERLDQSDLLMIVNEAKTRMANMPPTAMVSGKIVDPEDERFLAMAEATIAILNRKQCFKKFPKFDKTRRRFK